MKTATRRRIAGLAAAAAMATAAAFGTQACKQTGAKAETAEERAAAPGFNADSAYQYCARQCSFGPRTMNSEAHDSCGRWIAATFQRLGCKVTEQKATLRGYDGTELRATNIMASYAPGAKRRILILAHWDTRPWADNDPDKANHGKPIDGADDGASGVAVMMEVARLLSESEAPAVGVDFLCTDAEDWGAPQWEENHQQGDDWALGAQHFAANIPEGFAPEYGILLDMVGGKGAKFHREALSMHYAGGIVAKVWQAARDAGYGQYFPQADGAAVTDDHLPLNRAGIPTIDIIPFHPDCPQGSFGPVWHTLQDNMANIDKATLKAVGQTVVQTIYSE